MCVCIVLSVQVYFSLLCHTVFFLLPVITGVFLFVMCVSRESVTEITTRIDNLEDSCKN